MTTRIALSDTRAIDLDVLVDSRLLVQANSGGGKSWAIRRLLEQSHGKIQQLVIDPEGEFATLRERFDYVLAARHGGDTAADPRFARLLAERLLELGVSAILDIYELEAHQRIRFVKGFLEALVDAPKKLWHPALVVVDEAHVYCPQQGDAESARAVIDVCTRGRKRGFAPILATQRLSKLHKDAAAECNNKLIGRTGLDVDVRRAADELGFGKERWRELRELEPGQFFAFGPALSREVAAVRIGPVQTTHPKAGSRIAAGGPSPTRERIRALLPKLADLPAEVEEREKSMATLKRELAEVRRDLAVARKGPVPRDTGVGRKEVPVLKDGQLSRLEKLADRLAAIATTASEASRAIADQVKSVTVSGAPARSSTPTAVVPRRMAPAPAPRPLPRTAGNGAAPHVSGPQQRILDALAWLRALGIDRVDRVRAAMLADQSPRSSGYEKNISTLKNAGLIDYPGPGELELTPAGEAAAAPPEVPATDAALHEAIRRHVSTPQWRILEALIDTYPGAMGRESLAERAGASVLSSGYEKNVSTLRSLGLIDYPTRGEVVALPVLFVEGRA